MNCSRKRLLQDALELLEQARDLFDDIRADQPERIATAQLLVDDALNAYLIIETSEMKQRDRMEIVSRMTRACVLSEALQRPLQ